MNEQMLAELTNQELADRLEGYRDYGNPGGLNDILEEAANRLRNSSQPSSRPD